MSASFIIIYHSDRKDNLLQTLRFLVKREPLAKKSELVLICSDESESIEVDFKKIQHHNLKGSYNKPKICNFGVSAAEGEKIVLLDSDRIFPTGFLTEAVEKLDEKEFVTAKYLFHMHHPKSDEEIEDWSFKGNIVEKSADNLMYYPNMFSGSTVFFKDDYLSVGGMDEEYAGYWFNDTDMTENIIRAGMKLSYKPEVELHLKHSRTYEGDSQANFHRYCNKWGYSLYDTPRWKKVWKYMNVRKFKL